VKITLPISIKTNLNKIMLLAPLAAFIVPLVWMYLLNPSTFDNMWKGRTFQLFFVWLILLEIILGWETLQKNKISKHSKLRLIVFTFALLLPSVYVIFSNYFGLESAIAESSKQAGVYWYNDMPEAIEYLTFAGFFSLMTLANRGLNGLKNFAIPLLFAVLIGTVFVIDSVYPNGEFTPFQFLVPTTTTLAANALGFMGYQTTLNFTGTVPDLAVTDPANPTQPIGFSIAWPCAGIESLLIFTVTILLFLKRMPMSWQAKLGYFALGAAVTYVINVFRIVGIYLFALDGGDPHVFHQSIGPLFPIAWIVSYPLIILGLQSMRQKFTNKNTQKTAKLLNQNP
jgi:exosortase/archaeosortase family protein